VNTMVNRRSAVTADATGTPYRRLTVDAVHSYFVRRDDRWQEIPADTLAMHLDTREHVSVRDLAWDG
jgi:hypothetical protein